MILSRLCFRAALVTIAVVASTVQSAMAEERATRDVADRNKARVLSYLQQLDAAEVVTGSAQQRLRDLSASYMDTARIDSLGLKPLQADLAKIAKAQSGKNIAELYGQGNFIYVPLRVDVRPASANGAKPSIAISQSGLDLHTRDPYLATDPKAVEIREKFVTLVASLLDLVDSKDSRTRAAAILAFETEIAKVSRPEDRPRDATALAEPWTLSRLKKEASDFDRATYLVSNNIGRDSELTVSQPDVVRGVAEVIGRTDITVLKDHLTFSLICTWGWSGLLPQSVFDMQFDFYGRARRGATQLPSRQDRMYDFLNRALPLDLERLHTALETGGETNPQLMLRSDGPLIRRDDLYGNAKRAHFWNWQRLLNGSGPR